MQRETDKDATDGVAPASHEPTDGQMMARMIYALRGEHYPGDEHFTAEARAGSPADAVEHIAARPLAPPAAGKPDGYAVVMSAGYFVGIWRDEESAVHILHRSPSVKDERVEPMVYAKRLDRLQADLDNALRARCVGNTPDSEPVACMSWEASEQSQPCPVGCCVMAAPKDVRSILAAIEAEDTLASPTPSETPSRCPKCNASGNTPCAYPDHDGRDCGRKAALSAELCGTPRTEAYMEARAEFTAHESWVEFARQLERELAEANALAARWEEAFHMSVHAPQTSAPSATAATSRDQIEECANICERVADKARGESAGWAEKEAFLDGRASAAEDCAALIRALKNAAPQADPDAAGKALLAPHIHALTNSLPSAEVEPFCWRVKIKSSGMILWMMERPAKGSYADDGVEITPLFKSAPSATAATTDQETYEQQMKRMGLGECPITGRRFFMMIEHPTRGMVPTYGGPFDSFTIPEQCEDNELRSEHYDHDRGEWIEGGAPIAWISSEQPEPRSSDRSKA